MIRGGEKERYIDAREYEEIKNLILSPRTYKRKYTIYIIFLTIIEIYRTSIEGMYPISRDIYYLKPRDLVSIEPLPFHHKLMLVLIVYCLQGRYIARAQGYTCWYLYHSLPCMFPVQWSHFDCFPGD